MSNSKHFSLAELASVLGAELDGDPEYVITGLADLGKAVDSQISFLSSTKYASLLASTKASAVVLKAEQAETFSGSKLIVSDPYLAYATLSRLFETRKTTSLGVHPRAEVAASAKLGKGVKIGAFCVIGENAEIADDCEICVGSVIGDGVKIGVGGLIHPNVVIYHEVEIGERVIIHANTSIGVDGFGFAPRDGHWQKIHQIGRVVIGNDVEIGAGTTVDRGALEDTRIGDFVIIDDQVHIAHNVSVGDGSALAGCVGIAGSTKIGKNCLIGGAVCVAGHISIADGTIFNGATVVTRGNKEAGVFASAAPIQEVGEWRKNSARYRQLDTLSRRIKQLEKRLEECVPKSD